MANHKSALKRVRQDKVKAARNKYVAKTTRNVVRDIRASKDKKEVETMLPKVYGMLDKLVKKNIIHSNKAANLKSKLTKHLASL